MRIRLERTGSTRLSAALLPLLLLLPLAPLAAEGQELGIPADTQAAPESATPPVLGPSGTQPIPPASPGQTLPLTPTRRISFATDEGTALQPDLSPDGKTIVFAMLGDIYSLPAKGGEAKALTRGLPMDTQPAFSPDGKWIAFLSDRSGAENVWVMRPDGSGARQVSLYDDDPIFASPSWSADGKAIYASRYWPDRNAYELWRFDASGDVLGKVAIPNRPDGAEGDPHQVLGAVASPDGRYLYYAAHTGSLDLAEPVEWRIMRRDLASGQETVLVKAIGDIRLGPVQSSAFRPVVSHDGKWLAFAERRTGHTWLRLRELATGKERDLVQLDPDSLQASYWSDIAPHFAFTPQDDAILLEKNGKFHRLSLADGVLSPVPFIAQVEADLGPLTRAPTRVETGPVHVRIIQAPALSPDGSQIAFSALGRIYTLPLTGGTPRAIGGHTPPQFHPSWSADGRSLLFVSWQAERGGQVWRADLAGGTVTQLTSQDAFYTHPVFAPDGSVIVVRSPTADRLDSYVEFGQFRDAELVRLGKGEPQVLASGTMGGTPHFLADGTLLLNRPDGVHRVADKSLLAAVEGPNWYFAEGPADADDLRVSPDGKWALAQIAQQLHLVALPADGSAVNLSVPSPAHQKLTDVGADFFGWSKDGRTIYWSVGSTFYTRPLAGGRVQAVKADVALPRNVPQGTILLTGATILTMGPQGTIEEGDILISRDRIAALGPKGSLTVPEGTKRIDLAGRFVIPGLVDVHDHVADIRRDVLDFQPWGPAANLAYGVTTAFDPSTLTIDMLPYQDALDTGLTLGSRIFSTGTALFSFNEFRSPEQVEAVLSRYRDHYGLTNIKMYRSGNRRVREWIAQAALKLGLQPTTEGALAEKLDLSQILDGYSGNEHSIPPPHLYRDITEFLARSGTSYDLTLQITHGGYPAQDYFITRDAPQGDAKYARFAPPWFRDQKFWQRQWTAPEGYFFPIVAASAARFAKAGGLLSIGAHGEVPGLGTHWEMEAYQMGGMTPAEVLKAATIGGARTIGRAADLGSLEKGKLADLVVLDKDPRLDIANTLAIAEVMKGGELYEGGTLARIWPDPAPPPHFWFSPAPSPEQ